MQEKLIMDRWIKTDKARTVLRIILLTAIAALLLAYAGYIYKTSVIPLIQRGEYQDSFQNYLGLNGRDEVDDSTQVIQEIFVEDKVLSAVDLHTKGYADNDACFMVLQLRDAVNKEVIEEWERKSSEMTNSIKERFILSQPLVCEGRRELELVVTCKGAALGKSFRFYTSEEDCYEGNFYMNGEEEDCDLEFTLNYGEAQITKQFISPYFWSIMIACILFVILLTAVLFFKSSIKLEKVFLVTVLFLGMVYLFVLPPFTAPDEPGHFSTSYAHSNQFFGEEGTKARNCDKDFSFSYLLSSDSYRIIAEQGLKGTSDTAYGSELGIGIYNPTYSIQYLPQTLGIVIAKLFHMNYVQMLLMGQLFNLLFFLLCGYWAIRLMPFGKMIIVVMSLLPMTLSLAASYSYDAVINGLAILFLAYVLYLIYEKETIGWKELIILGILYILLIPCKLIYAVEGAAVIFIPRKKITIKLPKWLIIGGGAVIVAGVLFMLRGFLPEFQKMMDNTSGTIYDGREGYTIGMILQNPASSMAFFINSVVHDLVYYAASMAGAYLGWLNIYIPKWCAMIYLALLLLAAFLCCNEKKAPLTWKKRVVFLAAGGLACLMCIFIMWISWTALENARIAGVQGRYFLPVLPMLLLSVCNDRKFQKIDINREIIIVGSVTQIFVIVSILLTGFAA